MFWEPRQSCKTTLLDQMPFKSKYSMDDLEMRESAQNDLGLFFLPILSTLSWVEILQRNFILKLLPSFAANLSKRVVKIGSYIFFGTNSSFAVSPLASARNFFFRYHKLDLFGEKFDHFSATSYHCRSESADQNFTRV